MHFKPQLLCNLALGGERERDFNLNYFHLVKLMAAVGWEGELWSARLFLGREAAGRAEVRPRDVLLPPRHGRRGGNCAGAAALALVLPYPVQPL